MKCGTIKLNKDAWEMLKCFCRLLSVFWCLYAPVLKKMVSRYSDVQIRLVNSLFYGLVFIDSD